MTQQRRTNLKHLQSLDLGIAEAKAAIAAFDAQFEEVEQPALILEGDVGTTRTRLKEMKLEERRLESSTEEKRERLKRLEERVSSVRNLREEAAVSAELEMVRRALQNDETEAYSLLDQIRKAEDRAVELDEAFEEAKAILEPRIKALTDELEASKALLVRLQEEREAFSGTIDPQELRVYDAVRGEGRRAIAELTDDGACGNCFSMLPLQLQNEVRHGNALIRCEACGVILASPEPEVERVPEAESAPAEESAPGDEAGAHEDVGEDDVVSGDAAADDDTGDDTGEEDAGDEDAGEDDAGDSDEEDDGDA